MTLFIQHGSFGLLELELKGTCTGRTKKKHVVRLTRRHIGPMSIKVNIRLYCGAAIPVKDARAKTSPSRRVVKSRKQHAGFPTYLPPPRAL